MQKKILDYLNNLERTHKVEILLATETGSRAWGFASPDSDYDVRIIYKHQLDWYLNLFDQKDSIDYMLDENLVDISGWELRKSLQFLHKYNSSLVERIASPIIYKANSQFHEQLQELAKNEFSQIAALHHYLGLAKKSFAFVQNAKEYKLKSLFYALRAACACAWILQKNSAPPVNFDELRQGLNLDNQLENSILKLLEIKAQAKESYLHKGEQDLQNFIQSLILESESANNLSTKNKNSHNTQDLQDFFNHWILKNAD